MRVTRITLDADLGLIELQTGPGGDGNYVLLPLEISEGFQRYVTLAGEPCEAEAPVSPEFVDRLSGGTIVAPGGWSVPADQAYDYNATPGIGAYDADLANPPQFERGGIKYPDPAAHVGHALEGKEVFHITDLRGYTVAKIDNDRQGYGSSPGSARWLPNPLPVYALEHAHGYRVSSPFIRNWFTDIQKYELHLLPGLALEAADKLGKNTANTDIAIIVKEMD